MVRTSSRFGVRTGGPEVDLATIVEEKRRYLQSHRDESWQGALNEKRLTLLEGAAEFISPDQVRVGDRVVRSQKIFLASGMRPTVPEVDGLEDGPYLTNDTVMDLEGVPGHLIVIGGGYIGCELSQAFRRFGAEVSIVQRAPRLLPGEEPDASTVIERSFRQEGIDVLTAHELRSVRWADGRPTVEVTGPDSASRSLVGTHLLVAAGRTRTPTPSRWSAPVLSLIPGGLSLSTTSSGQPRRGFGRSATLTAPSRSPAFVRKKRRSRSPTPSTKQVFE